MNHPDTDRDFDLDAYLDRIGYAGERMPTLAVLSALCSAHPAAIPFENIDPLLGRPPSLRIVDVQAKLVGAQRGGYCFEHNALLRRALLALGFGVTSLAARVVWMAPPDLPLRPRTHMLLLVEAEGQRHVVDAGFGGHLINVPLQLETESVQSSPVSHMRLTQSADVLSLESRLPEGWSPLYLFTLEPQLPADYEPLNWFTATHPASIFRHNLLMERLTPATRANLLNDRLTLRNVGEAPRVQRIGTADEFGQVMSEVFGLHLPVPAADLFERVPKGRDAPFMPPQ
ncbi:MAG: arylamine N-acetyltransferase [Burkholderiales bacterium]